MMTEQVARDLARSFMKEQFGRDLQPIVSLFVRGSWLVRFRTGPSSIEEYIVEVDPQSNKAALMNH